jgi:hypothetical protein
MAGLLSQDEDIQGMSKRLARSAEYCVMLMPSQAISSYIDPIGKFHVDPIENGKQDLSIDYWIYVGSI